MKTYFGNDVDYVSIYLRLADCRYIAVTQPIKYARHKNHKRVWLTIGLVWAISGAIGLPIVLGLNHTPSRDPALCMFYNSDFVIYSSLSSFYIPCLIMIFLYYRIFQVNPLIVELNESEEKKSEGFQVAGRQSKR